ncbi:NCS2 family permease [Kordia jejudonensis]|uniref:NCS2 family permease n=1 Tax=Kordia jejudonensis TaxID=1348245 RepID=UPI000629AB40|nr:NCS2 family permease [Kordia jejudonensis]
MIKKIRLFFDFEYHKTDFKTEIIAGLSTFLAMSYIFIVNPAILSEGGIDKSAALFATVVVSAIATIVMGLWAKKPFALAPGLEMNSYVVYFLIIGHGTSWEVGLGAVFWSGILFLILTITKFRKKIIEAIPDSLKIGLAACVGVFLIIIALKLSNILVYEETNIKTIGELFSLKSGVLILGVVSAITLHRLKIKGFILISIVLCTLMSHLVGLYEVNDDVISVNKNMLTAIGALDVTMILDTKMLSAVIILFVVDFYGSIAKFIGLTQNTSILDEKGKLPNQKEALLVDGVATVAGSVIGTTSITTFVESGVGIAAGGRTGFTAIICGLLMLLFIPLAPIVNLVPLIATTGALAWVGMKLMPKVKQLRKIPFIERVTILLMILVTIITFALDKAMLVGFGFYIIANLVFQKKYKINIYLIVSVIIIILSLFLT